MCGKQQWATVNALLLRPVAEAHGEFSAAAVSTFRGIIALQLQPYMLAALLMTVLAVEASEVMSGTVRFDDCYWSK